MENSDIVKFKADAPTAPVGAHHPNSPSTLPRRELCPGSYRMEAMLRQPVASSEDAQKGSRIHEAVAKTILAWKAGLAPSSRMADETFTAMGDDEIELHDAIIDFVQSEVIYNGFDVQALMPETRLEYRNISGVLYYGTSDLVYVDKQRNMAWLYDWKTGFRRVNDAANNLQGAGYALAVSQMYGVDAVTVTFFNPAIRQHTSYSFDEMMLMAIAKQIECIIARCLDPNAPFCPGEEQCRYCLGALTGACSAYMAQETALANVAEDGRLLPISELPDASLTTLLEQCRNIEKLQKAIETELKLRIAKTGSCAGYTIKSSAGGREARDLDGIYSVVQDYYSPTDFMQFCTLSIAKLEKDVAKKMKVAGETKTEKDAKELFGNRIAQFVSEKAPKQVITPPPAVIEG